MAQAAHNASLNLQVGSRVQVYWPDDDAWYTGTVSALNVERRVGVVDYDDGDIEELELDHEQVKLVGEALAGGGEGVSPGEADGSRPKRHKPNTFGKDEWLTDAAPRAGGGGGGGGGGLGGGGQAWQGPAGGAAAAAAGAGADQRLLVRFANPNAGGRAEGGEGASPNGGVGAGAFGGGVPRTGAPPRAQQPGGGAPRPQGAPQPRSHAKGGSGGGRGAQAAHPLPGAQRSGQHTSGRDKGAAADGARALVAFNGPGPAWNGKPYGASDASAVRSWLEARGMGRYAPLFHANEIDFETLPFLTLQDLRDLPIHAVGPRRKLLAALERL